VNQCVVDAGSRLISVNGGKNHSHQGSEREIACDNIDDLHKVDWTSAQCSEFTKGGKERVPKDVITFGTKVECMKKQQKNQCSD